MRPRRWLPIAIAGACVAAVDCNALLGIQQFAPNDLDGGVAGDASVPRDGSADAATDGSPGDVATINDANGGDVATTIDPAHVVIAHTAPGVPPFRVCFGTASPGGAMTVTPLPALPDSPGGAPSYPATGPFPAVALGTPGIYPGTIGALPSLGVSLASLAVTPFLVLASSIAGDVSPEGGAGVQPDGGPQEDCVHLIGTHGLGTGETATGATKGRLSPNVDYFPFAPIPSGALLDGQTFLLTVNGCLPGGAPVPAAAASGWSCGPASDGGINNTSIGIVQLDTTTVAGDGGIAVQFAHRSVALENTPIVCSAAACGSQVELHTPATDGVWPAFFQTETIFDAGPDGEATTVIQAVSAGAAPTTYSGTGLVPAPATVLAIKVDDPNTLFGVFVQPLDGGAPNALPWPGVPVAVGGAGTGDVLALPLSTIAQLSSWNGSAAAAPHGFEAGRSYTFLLVGDPSAQPIPNQEGGAGINPLYDGRGLHFVAFPNVFTPGSL